jgi:hypothetical protein
MARIGFVLLTHANPPQIDRLVRRLVRSYGPAPIVCHHDFTKCPIDAAAYPDLHARVEFVVPWHQTSWAHISVVDGYLEALRRLYRRPDAPDWVVVLSGADYPVRSADEVLSELDAGGADAYMQHAPVDPRAWRPPPDDAPEVPEAPPHGFMPGEGPRNTAFTAKRYGGAQIPAPVLDAGRLRLRWRLLPYPALTAWLTPFSARFRCYAGSQWHTLGRRAAQHLVEWTDANPWLRRFYATRPCSDESLPHTVLGNAPQLRIANRSTHFIDWSAEWFSPATLTLEHLPAILASGAHFARKFDPAASAALLDALDQRLDDVVAPSEAARATAVHVARDPAAS